MKSWFSRSVGGPTRRCAWPCRSACRGAPRRTREFSAAFRKVDVRLPGNGSSNSHGARPVHLIIITMIKWIRTGRLSIKNSLFFCRVHHGGQLRMRKCARSRVNGWEWQQHTALEATQGQMGGFFSQLPYNATSKRWHLWEIDLRSALNSTPGCSMREGCSF